MSELGIEVSSALKEFGAGNLKAGAQRLLSSLGYSSRKTVNIDGTAASFLHFADPSDTLSDKQAARVSEWEEIQFLFQLTNDELPLLAQRSRDLFLGEQDYRRSIIESFVFIALQLPERDWTRTELAGITREVNRLFPMPALMMFRYGNKASLAVIDRRENKLDRSRDVLERRISVVKDINLEKPHRAHVDILCDMALDQVKVRGRGTPSNFRDLYDGWLEALSAQALNARFYKALANWFFWSVKEVTFPAAALENEPKDRDKQNQIAVIRLLTRLIFVWFIKEKGLVSQDLFELEHLRTLLKEDPSKNRDASTYYKAILQNLFFATLNTEMSNERTWRTKAVGGGLDGQYLVHSAYRYQEAFKAPDAALELFRQVPFLNGGLFECLDRELSAMDIARDPSLERRAVNEGTRKVVRIDGFSERKENTLNVPNKIFFAQREHVDLNKEYDTKGRNYEADGLIELFSSYKFTVEENTPAEEEVALDPELLGKVFENLLASYNEDTQTTARKKSGSFYTPREVVEYMVDEALIAYFEPRLASQANAVGSRRPTTEPFDFGPASGELDLVRSDAATPSSDSSTVSDIGERLRELLSTRTGNPFSSIETDTLIGAIDGLRALDPACGSGAFPMGLLQKLIHILHKLDPDNSRWRAQNERPFRERIRNAAQLDPVRREAETDEAEAALVKLKHDFSDANLPDYSRKLYLIDKCLFGVDIQPIAVQIAKLRFFISLVVSQKIDRSQKNANITALPNLETKLVAANSLIPIERTKQADLFRSEKIAEMEASLRALQERYFSAPSAKAKRARREAISSLRDELADLLTNERGLPEIEAKKMAAWDQFDQNSAAPFFDPEWMFGLATKFDLVIANPPYVRQEAIKEQKPLLKWHYGGQDKLGAVHGAYSGTADLLVYFIQRGVELLNPGGAFAYITSNKWYRAKYGERLRGWINRHAALRRILDFGDAEVFDALAYPTIIIATRRDVPVLAPKDSDIVRVMNWPVDRDRSEVEGFRALLEIIGFDMPQKSLSAKGWQLEPQAKRGLLDRIRSAGVPLGQYVERRFYRGILTGFNEAFVIDGPTKDRLVTDHSSSAEIVKPFLRGRDIKRWRVEPQDCWLIFTRRGIDIAQFPAVERFLSSQRKKLEPKPGHWDDKRDGHWQGRKAGSYKWYEIQDNIAYWKEFERPKIVYPDIALHSRFSWDESGALTGDTTFLIPDAPRWLVGLLNSAPIEWFYAQLSPRIQGGFLRFKSTYVEQIPVPRATPEQQMAVETVARALAELNSESRLEQLLNGFVYELLFPEDLGARGLLIFDEAERAGFGKLAGLEGDELVKAVEAFTDLVFTSSHPLYSMLFDLQALEVVRVIEGEQ